MKQNVIRILAVLCVVAVGVWAFMRAQRPGAPVAQTAAVTVPAEPAKAPQKLFDLPAQPIPKPQPTTVYRASEIPAAVPATPATQPSQVVQASATEPQPLPAANAKPIDTSAAPPANPLRSAAGAAEGIPVNPLRESRVRQASDERPAMPNGATPPARNANGDAAQKELGQLPASSTFAGNTARSNVDTATMAQPYPAAAPARPPEATVRFPVATGAGTEVATRGGSRERAADDADSVRLEPYSPPAKMPGNAASARAMSAGNDFSSAGRTTTMNERTKEPAAAEGTGQPGKKEQEGPQSPQVSIQKFAPEGVQVGKPAVFRVAVRNAGSISAHGVEVRDQIPKGTQLISTKPRASRGTSGELIWELGTLKPGDEATVEMEVMPVAEGELGSVAAVRFNAEASARTVATKPELVLKSVVPNKVLIGEELAVSITISNPGSGAANNVVLVERIPAGLQHPAGPELEYQVGTLKPGEQKQIQLTMTAVQAGKLTNVLSAHGEGNLRTEDRRDVEVIAPQLDVSMDGPRRRFLEREATYVMAIANNGSAPAKQVELVAYLPRGLKFVSANNAGQYDAGNQTVHWTLAELPASDSDKVELVTLPIEAGEHKLRLEGKAEKGLAVEKEQSVVVEGIAAIKFEVVDTVDPIEKGGETVYEIHVVNQGSKTANNVRITAMVPTGMRAMAAEGPTRFTLEANRVQFESLARLAPKAETTYRVRVQGLRPGDLRIRVQLLTDEMQEPVTKEESTRVYADE